MDSQTTCPQCRGELALKDWTCPRCGAIMDRYLFSTVTLQSVEGEGRKAYEAGQQDCGRQMRERGSTVIARERYLPPVGYETAYRAGWQRAADEFAAKADRRFGRRRGLRVLGSGVLLLVLGGGIAVGTHEGSGGHLTLLVVSPIGLGVVNVVLGIVMMLTGENDEARPEG